MSTRIETHSLTKDDVRPILRSIALFGGLTDEQLDVVFPFLESASFHEGETIFKEGSPPDHIYIVRSGRVGIVCSMDTDPFELIECGAGDCFGEMSVIGIQPHSASAIARTDTDLIVLSRKSIRNIHDANLEVFSLLIMNIAREACRRLFKTDRTLLHYAHHEEPGSLHEGGENK